MSKSYVLDNVKDLSGRLEFNHKIVLDGKIVYYIMRIRFIAIGANGAASRNGKKEINIGEPSEIEFTPKQIYTKIKKSMGTAIANTVKDLYIELINDDISELE